MYSPKSGKRTEEFEQTMEFVLRWEGGYVNHPDDPGGETNYGISRRAHPKADIAGMTREQALEIYRADYWGRLGLDGLPNPIAVTLMDTAVNMGPGRSVGLLQAAVNDLSGDKRLKVDGVMGPRTQAVVMETCRCGAGHGPCRMPQMALAQRMLLLRAARYSALAAEPKLKGFLRGWLNRATALGDLIIKPINKEKAR